MVALDGYRGGVVSGLEMIDDKLADNNETTHRGKLLPLGKTVTIVCSVRKEGARVVAAGNKIIEWNGDSKRLSLRDLWKVKRNDTLFLGAFSTRFLIRKMEIVEISGNGKSIR